VNQSNSEVYTDYCCEYNQRSQIAVYCWV